MPRKYSILALVGDGIAGEIVPEAVKVLEASRDRYGFDYELVGPHAFGAQYYVDHDMEAGSKMPGRASTRRWTSCSSRAGSGRPISAGKTAPMNSGTP